MASGKALNAANLEALGAPRLAELLLQISADDPTAKRQLRLALAGSAGAAQEIAKRLASIARAKTFLEGQALKSLAADLDAQRRAILELVAPIEPRDAFDLMWRLVSCAGLLFARSDDSNGRLSSVFGEAVTGLGPLARAAAPDPAALAHRAFQALRGNSYSEWDELVPTLAPQLGAPGLAALKTMMTAWQAEPVRVPPERDRRVIGWSTSGKIYADQIETSHRQHTASFVLRQIADLGGNVDDYAAQFDSRARTMPRIAADIARRLLQANRPQDAWQTLENVDPARRDRGEIEWEEARVETLEALGRTDAAQAYRLQRFHATLNADHLRAYLRKLPDFEDFEAEQDALTHAAAFENVHQALVFLVQWPDLRRAGDLVLARTQELDGNLYELLAPAADALDDKHPLAATFLRRAMIDFSLNGSRSSRYKHAARHLHECANLARRLTDFAGAPDHATYEQTLRRTHGRKAAFWQETLEADS